MSVSDQPWLVDLSAEGGGHARRAVIRWAWRLFCREWRQHLLVLTLLTVAVAATTAGAGFATNTQSSPAATFGTASYHVAVPGSGAHLAADIAAMQRRFGPIEVIAHQKIAIPGSVDTVDLRAQDPGGPYGHPMLRLVAGRYPTGPNEVAVNNRVAGIFKLRLGDRWHQGRARRVVGLVENPANLLDEFALVAPGQVSSPDNLTILLDSPAASFASFQFPNGAAVESRGRSAQTRAVIDARVLLLATIGMLFVGL